MSERLRDIGKFQPAYHYGLDKMVQEKQRVETEKKEATSQFVERVMKEDSVIMSDFGNSTQYLSKGKKPNRQKILKTKFARKFKEESLINMRTMNFDP